MIKKVLIGVSLVALLALGAAGLAFAQGPDEPGDGFCPFGQTCGGVGGGYGMGGFGYRGTMPGILAETLGMTLDELSVALAEGKTIAEIAAAQGVELQDLVAALIAPRAESLKQAVQDGDLTQEQADAMIEEMTEHMTLQLENMGSGGYGGGCGMRGGGWGTQSSGRGFRGGRGMRGGVWGNGTNARRPMMNTL